MSSIAAVAGVVQGFDEAEAPGQVTILRMEGGTTLAPHCGPRNSRLTAHLPLIIPETDEPKQGERFGLRVGRTLKEESIEVGGEGDAWRMWEEGEVLIFDDSFEHEARWPEASAEVSPEAASSGGDLKPWTSATGRGAAVQAVSNSVKQCLLTPRPVAHAGASVHARRVR